MDLPQSMHSDALGFQKIATYGKCFMGWFFVFKLHLICNEKGELLNFMFTLGNLDDRIPLNEKGLIEQIVGKLFADKVYISQKLFEKLFIDGIQLIRVC